MELNFGEAAAGNHKVQKALAGTTPPLAERMRPQRLDQYVGQQHLVGPGKILRKLAEEKRLHSLILWGPPGVGKTTLARILAAEQGRPFFALSAVQAGVKEVREVLDKAAKLPGTILFIDEIHRFNKSQQDALLKAVEEGLVTLMGATTENPSMELNSALLSRCRVYVLEALSREELTFLITHALETDEQLAPLKAELLEDEALVRLSGGDARSLLNLVELVVTAAPQPIRITDELVMQLGQTRTALYDKNGEQHYDIISAFIKSIRGGDPNAAMYWLARLIEGGEEPKFIVRRLVILASEDIGNANPTAMVMASAALQSVQFVGWPESRIILGQLVCYLASSPKSNASYMAINAAQALVRQTGDLPVPLHLRNAPTKLMKNLGYGQDYLYAHDYPGNFVNQEFMPESLEGTVLYTPQKNAREDELRRHLKHWWQEKYGY